MPFAPKYTPPTPSPPLRHFCCPCRIEILVQRALVKFLLERYAEAAGDYAAALEDRPDDVALFHYHGICLFKVGLGKVG